MKTTILKSLSILAVLSLGACQERAEELAKAKDLPLGVQIQLVGDDAFCVNSLVFEEFECDTRDFVIGGRKTILCGSTASLAQMKENAALLSAAADTIGLTNNLDVSFMASDADDTHHDDYQGSKQLNIVIDKSNMVYFATGQGPYHSNAKIMIQILDTGMDFLGQCSD